MKRFILFALCASALFSQTTTTTVSVGSALSTQTLKPGINLGTFAPYGSQQIYKNLFAQNPGFTNTYDSSFLYCGSGTNNNLCVSTNYNGQGSSFWPSGSPVTVITGTGRGTTCTVSSWSNPDLYLGSGCNLLGSGTFQGVYVQVSMTYAITGSNLNSSSAWTTSGYGTLGTDYTFSISTDTPSGSSSNTQSIDMAATSSTGAAYLATYGIDNLYFNTTTGPSYSSNFLDLNGTYTITFWAKAISGTSPSIFFYIGRSSNYQVSYNGSSPASTVTIPITTSWAQYTVLTYPTETGTQSGAVQAHFGTTSQEEFRLTKLSMVEPTTSGNSTMFRDAVVNHLKALAPGTIRDWDNESLTNTMANMLADQYSRQASNFSQAHSSPLYSFITYSYPEFLQLCQTVGSNPWIVIPVSTTTAEAQYFIDYLAGGSGTSGGALRIAQGQTTPWTSVFSHIYIEVGNEEWNPIFEGGSMEGGGLGSLLTGYSVVAQSIFSTMKASADYSSVVNLVVGGQEGYSYNQQQAQLYATSNDSMAVGPYHDDNIQSSQFDTTQDIWQPALAQGQVFWLTGAASGANQICQNYISGSLCPSYNDIYIANYTTSPTYGNFYGGGMYLNQLTQGYGPTGTTGKQLLVYEEGVIGSGGGSTNNTQSQLNAYTSAWGQGLAEASQFMNNMLNGVIAQNYYQLYQYTVPNFTNASGVTEYFYGWGCAIDAGGPTNGRFRPQCLVEQTINSAIGSSYTMLSTTNSASGLPCGTSSSASCFSVGNPSTSSAVNAIATRPIPIVQSFAFSNSTGYALILLNDDTQYSQTINFSGSIVPTGSVTKTLLTSTNLSDTNESSNVISPVTSTLSSPTSLTMPPFSMVTLTWGASSPTNYNCINTSADAAAIQSRVSAGGTVTITGTCDMTSTVTVGNAIQFTGSATFNGSVSPIFSVSANSVGFNGFTFSNESAVSVSEITAGVPNQYFTFTNNTIQNTNGADGLDFSPIMQYATINYNHFSSIAANGFASFVFNGSCYATNTCDQPGTGISGLQGWDNSTIQHNTFDLVANDGIHLAWNEIVQQRYYFETANVSVSYNTFTRVHRISIEAQGTNNYQQCTSPGNPVYCTSTALLASVNWKVAGNYVSNMFQVYSETMGYSLVTGNNGQIINNTGTYNSWSNLGTNPCAPYAQETAGNTLLTQGNVYTSDNVGASGGCSYNTTTGWSDIVSVLGAEGTNGGSTLLTVQNNYACSNGLSSTIISNETNGATLPRVEQYNYAASTCPRAGSLTTSSITPSYISNSSNTYNFGVASNLSIQYVTFYVDGTSIGTQELGDVNTNFASTQQWLYHTTITPTSYSSGTHTLSMVATDVGGNNSSSASTTFSGGGSGTPISLSPAFPTVQVGGTVTLTASGSATFTCLVCNGGTISSTSTTVTYTAPSTIANPPGSLLGVQIAPPASVFTTPVNNLPVNTNNSLWKTNSSTLALTFVPAWGQTYLDSSSSTKSYKSYVGNYSNTFPISNYETLRRESGNLVGNALSGLGQYNHHIMGVDITTNVFYDTLDDLLNNQTVTCSDGVTTGCNVQTAISYPWSNYQVQTGGGTDMAGLPLAPLALTLAELKSGYIGHALKMSVPTGYLLGGGTANLLLWPASLSNGCSTCTNAPIIGARAKVNSSWTISGASTYTTTLLTALKNFGVIFSDVGTTNSVIVDLDTSNDTLAQAAFAQITGSGLSIANGMTFIDESSLETSSTSYQVCPYNTTCPNGAQTYVNPPNQVIVQATGSGGYSVTSDIAIQGVTIGSKLPANLYMQTGSYTFQFSGWVNGSSNQTINWSSTGAGSITSSGVYTPGASGTTIVTGTAAADSTSQIVFNVTILAAGTIRIDTGASSNTTDGNSNTWLGGWQPKGCINSYTDGTWQTSSVYRVQFQSGCYANNSDLVYDGIILPNGDYDVTIYLGLKAQCGQLVCGTFLNNPLQTAFTYAPLSLESNGQVSYALYDWLLPVSYVSAMPTPTVTIPGWVQNNKLYVAVRSVANDSTPHYTTSGGQKITTLQGLTIATSANATPHWTINTQQQSTISSGQTLNPFLVIPWFTAAPSTVIWSVQGPPGISINSTTGVLTASSSTFYAAQPVTVTATNGTLSASATIYTLATQYIF